MKNKIEFIRGEQKMLYDGRTVTILHPNGPLIRVLNEQGKIEMVGRNNFRKPEDYKKAYGRV